MSNISDEIDALAQHAEPQTELARTRLALAEARRINAELVEALEDMFALIAEGYFVRDTTDDALPNFGMRQLPFVRRLQKADAAIRKAKP